MDNEDLEGDLVDEHDEEDEEDDDERIIATMTADDLRRLLAARGPLREVLFRQLTPGVRDIMGYPMSSMRRNELPEYREPVPSPEGQKLMESGDFGVVGD